MGRERVASACLVRFMCERVISKAVIALATVQVLFLTIARPMSGADRGKPLITSPTKSTSSVTNLRESLKAEEYFPREFQSLQPQRAPNFGIQPPPRPPLPSRREMEDKMKKENWGAITDPMEAFGNQSAKALPGAKQEDAVAISGTSEGSIERFMRKSDTEVSAQEEQSFEAALRRLREGDMEAGELDMEMFSVEDEASMTDSYRPWKSGQSLVPKPASNATRLQPSNRSLFDGYSFRSLQQESLSGARTTFREFLDDRTAGGFNDLQKSPLPTLKPENPISAVPELEFRAVNPIAAPITALNPLGSSVSQFSPFGNSPALNSGFRNSGGGSGFPASPVIQPFGPLPKRNF